VAALTAICIQWVPVEAQESFRLRGSVRDPAGSGISHASVRVQGTLLETTTSASGAFVVEIPSLPATLRVSRLGYRTEVVRIDSSRVGLSASFTVVLRPEPVVLQGLSVTETPERPFGQTVSTDMVRQVPPLAEADVFRGIVALPGVTQPNDLTGRIHLAGGPSDETLVRLDGHPLQDPFHLVGLLGAFNVAALERADVRMAHLPISHGGTLSGELALRSRASHDEARSEVVASLLDASYTTIRPDLPGGLDLLASGRVSYADRVVPVFAPDAPRIGFYDGLVRLGRSWGSGWRSEALGFTTGNEFRGGDLKDIHQDRPLRWGESLVGMRLDRSEGRWRVHLRGSVDHESTSLDERPVGTDVIDEQRDWWSAAARVSGRWRRLRVTAGASLDRRIVRQAWTAAGLADELFSPHTPGEYSGRQALTRPRLFAEVSAAVTSRLTATVGGRFVRAAGAWHAGPRATLSFEPGAGLRFAGSVSRRYQFAAQLEEPIEGSIHPPEFLLDVPRRGTMAAVRAEWRPSDRGAAPRPFVAVQGFWMHEPDRTLLGAVAQPDASSADFPEFRRIDARSYGAYVRARVPFGDAATVEGSYSFQRSVERVDGRLSPSSWDTPQNVVLFGTARLLSGWRATALLRIHSGRAVTPVRARIFEPFPDLGGKLRERFLLGERNSARLESYHRLDVGLKHSWDWLEADWTLNLQVLNVLGSPDPIGIDHAAYLQALQDDRSPGPGRTGLPVLPSVGLEVRW